MPSRRELNEITISVEGKRMVQLQGGGERGEAREGVESGGTTCEEMGKEVGKEVGEEVGEEVGKEVGKEVDEEVDEGRGSG